MREGAVVAWPWPGRTCLGGALESRTVELVAAGERPWGKPRMCSGADGEACVGGRCRARVGGWRGGPVGRNGARSQTS